VYYINPSRLGGDSRYTFAVGLVRVLEAKLLSQQAVNRLLDARDMHALKRELGETEYHHLLSVSPDLHDFEAELHQGLKRVYELMSAVAPEPELINLLRLRYDFHNLKTGYKAKYFGESADTALSDLGLVDKDRLMQMVMEDDFRRFPLGLSELVARIAAGLGSASRGAAVDIAFDKALYSFLYQQAKRFNSLFLQGLFQQYIDLTNLKSWLRVKKRKGDKRLLNEALLDYGFIERRRWLDLYDAALSDLPAKLAYTPYAKLINEGFSRYQQRDVLAQLPRLMDNHLLEYMNLARLVCMGHEPLIAYIWAKENEVKVLRTILVGKLNELPSEVIKERLPVVYG
jgi:V/A-type H+-transporting ATPase subunit C